MGSRLLIRNLSDYQAMDSSLIKVHRLTEMPSAAWDILSTSCISETSSPMPLDAPIKPNTIRIVCISDTHNRLEHMKHRIPYGDVLVHAGDFTMRGSVPEIALFNEYLRTLPHPVKIVIAGNHELTLDMDLIKHSSPKKNIAARKAKLSRVEIDLLERNLKEPKDALTNCIYLQDSSHSLYGYQVYGSPWSPRFCDWAFNLDRGEECLNAWNRIPTDTDILITHGPPLGHGDCVIDGERAGCVELLTSVEKRIRPMYHIFGHIHEGHGITTNGVTSFINAAICDVRYRPINDPVIFDLPIRSGWRRCSDTGAIVKTADV